MSHLVRSLTPRFCAPVFSKIVSLHTASRLALVALTLCAFGLLALHAPASAASQTRGVSLDALLRPDGTLNRATGMTGTFNVQGWNVALDPKRGPVFSRTNGAPAANETWTGIPYGLNNDVNIVAFNGNDVYVGGSFTGLCNDIVCGNPTNMNNIARWDGSAWHTLGFGVSDDVFGLYVSGDDVYVSGYFIQLCGNAACNSGNTTVNRIARWDGSAWHALGNGLSRNPYVILQKGTDFYVGGYFTDVCGNPACNSGNTTVNHIARWDGSAWHSVGHGLSEGSASPAVTALEFNGSDLLAGGGFTSICGNDACNSSNTTVRNAARWDGSAWHAMGNGVDNTIYRFGIIGSSVYAGGDFGQLCGNAACNSGNTRTNYIARWDGSQWNTVGNGLDGSVFDLAVNGQDLYVGGGFTHLCGNITCDSGNTNLNHVARWDGSWHALGNGVSGNVYTIKQNGIDLYIGGNFISACGNAACNSGNTTVNRIAKLTLQGTQTPPTFLVNTDNDTDDGLCDIAGQGYGNKDCTLREAINAANAQGGANTIHFDGDHTVNLAGTLPTLTGDTTIDGGSNKILVDGGGAYRILTVETPITLNVNRMFFNAGKANPSLTFGHSGGAIYNHTGTLQVSNSTFASNDATNYGGAIFSVGTTVISNSSFVQNSAGDIGGGVSASDVTVLNSSFHLNTSPLGAGLYAGNSLTLKNSILGNSSGPDCSNAGTLGSAQNNLIQNTGSDACGLVNGTNGNLIGFDPAFGPFAFNGGNTPVMTLKAISPAIDAGDDGTCAAAPVSGKDQRGITRPFGTHCDMGAFEKTTADCDGSEIPAKPVLLKPTKNQTMNKTSVKFDWTDTVCKTNYKITVKNTTTGAKVTKTITPSKATLTLAHGKQKWTVEACNANGCTKSKAGKFTN